jgi:hypothetical protein
LRLTAGRFKLNNLTSAHLPRQACGLFYRSINYIYIAQHKALKQAVMYGH